MQANNGNRLKRDIRWSTLCEKLFLEFLYVSFYVISILFSFRWQFFMKFFTRWRKLWRTKLLEQTMLASVRSIERYFFLISDIQGWPWNPVEKTGSFWTKFSNFPWFFSLARTFQNNFNSIKTYWLDRNLSRVIFFRILDHTM